MYVYSSHPFQAVYLSVSSSAIAICIYEQLWTREPEHEYHVNATMAYGCTILKFDFEWIISKCTARDSQCVPKRVFRLLCVYVCVSNAWNFRFGFSVETSLEKFTVSSVEHAFCHRFIIIFYRMQELHQSKQNRCLGIARNRMIQWAHCFIY